MDQQQSSKKMSPKREIYYGFMMDTPVPGFRNVYRSKIHWQLIWIIFMIASWTIAGYQTTLQIITYLQFDKNTAVTVEVSFIYKKISSDNTL